MVHNSDSDTLNDLLLTYDDDYDEDFNDIGINSKRSSNNKQAYKSMYTFINMNKANETGDIEVSISTPPKDISYITPKNLSEVIIDHDDDFHVVHTTIEQNDENNEVNQLSDADDYKTCDKIHRNHNQNKSNHQCSTISKKHRHNIPKLKPCQCNKNLHHKFNRNGDVNQTHCRFNNHTSDHINYRDNESSNLLNNHKLKTFMKPKENHNLFEFCNKLNQKCVFKKNLIEISDYYKSELYGKNNNNCNINQHNRTPKKIINTNRSTNAPNKQCSQDCLNCRKEYARIWKKNYQLNESNHNCMHPPDVRQNHHYKKKKNKPLQQNCYNNCDSECHCSCCCCEGSASGSGSGSSRTPSGNDECCAQPCCMMHCDQPDDGCCQMAQPMICSPVPCHQQCCCNDPCSNADQSSHTYYCEDECDDDEVDCPPCACPCRCPQFVRPPPYCLNSTYRLNYFKKCIPKFRRFQECDNLQIPLC